MINDPTNSNLESIEFIFSQQLKIS